MTNLSITAGRNFWKGPLRPPLQLTTAPLQQSMRCQVSGLADPHLSRGMQPHLCIGPSGAASRSRAAAISADSAESGSCGRLGALERHWELACHKGGGKMFASASRSNPGSDILLALLLHSKEEFTRREATCHSQIKALEHSPQQTSTQSSSLEQLALDWGLEVGRWGKTSGGAVKEQWKGSGGAVEGQ